MQELKVGIRSMTQAVETLSGGQRQCVAVARAAAFAQHVVIMDEPTAALGVKEGNMVLELIRRVRDKGLPVVLICHNMPHVFEIADRIHVARLGKRAAVLNPKKISMSDTVAVMTGALPPEQMPAECLAIERGGACDDRTSPIDARRVADADAAAPARLQPGRHAPVQRARGAAGDPPARRSCPKAEIARLTHLTAQTVQIIIARLEADDLVRKRAPVRGKVGQPSVPMALNPDGAFSIGIKIGRRSLDMLLVDFTGAGARTPVAGLPVPRPRHAVRRDRHALRQLRKRSSPALRERLHGIGVAAPLSLGGWQRAARRRAGARREVERHRHARAHGGPAPPRLPRRVRQGHRRRLRGRAGGRPRPQHPQLPVRLRRHLHRRRPGDRQPPARRRHRQRGRGRLAAAGPRPRARRGRPSNCSTSPRCATWRRCTPRPAST